MPASNTSRERYVVIGVPADQISRLVDELARFSTWLNRRDKSCRVVTTVDDLTVHITIETPTDARTQEVSGKIKELLCKVLPRPRRRPPMRRKNEILNLILAELAKHPEEALTTTQIADRLGIPYQDVNPQVARCKREGLIEQVGSVPPDNPSKHGRWSALYKLTQSPQG